MTSGYVANQGLLSTIIEQGDWVASDAFNHASIVDGLRLSRGERQRVTIGRALLSEPRLLLLDEPLTGLDGQLREAILEQLKFLPNEFELPILYVTHDRAEAIELCEEALLIERGKIMMRGKPKDL
jgi:molybdate transport system ATP-binding protein